MTLQLAIGSLFALVGAVLIILWVLCWGRALDRLCSYPPIWMLGVGGLLFAGGVWLGLG